MRSDPRAQLRVHALDGALLLFRPATGDSIRVDAPETRGLRRSAPRAVFFGLSHACNLRCGFCSRDATLPDRWSADEAVALLRALADAGVLEVAFGGGEPLAYAGFLDLLRRLHDETRLALHFTTNGALVDAPTARALASLVGEVRVSIYDGEDWVRPIETLTAAGARTAANLLVTPASLDALPGTLSDLAALGCADVALLRYVGPDPSSHLAEADWARLEHAVRAAPLPVRLSRCFADRLPRLPRLFAAGADCGAGHDFLVIDPDRTFRACSFHEERRPFRDAQDLLAQYRAASMAAAGRDGCARPLPAWSVFSPGVRVYRGFASNNSGDTVLVARFASVDEPRELAERIAGLESDQTREEWRRVLEGEGCDLDLVHYAPRVEPVGRTLLATGVDAGDALAGLRAMVERRGAEVLYTAVHVHEPATLLVGVGAATAEVEASLRAADATDVQRHGGALLATFGDPAWDRDLATARTIGQAARVPVAAELVATRDAQRLVDALKSPLGDLDPAYFQAWFWSEERARAFADHLDGTFSLAGSTVLLDVTRFRKRLAVRVQEAGGMSSWLPRGPVRVRASLYRRDYREGPLPPEEVDAALLATGGSKWPFTLDAEYRTTSARLVTGAPHDPIAALARAAAHLDVRLALGLEPERPLAHAVGRVRHELTVLTRGAR
ncbi:MAG: radical SAM protein [Sandaracinaceae bacterium]|nr:radical SAM protein [Sandaracinaceae bacterium]